MNRIYLHLLPLSIVLILLPYHSISQSFSQELKQSAENNQLVGMSVVGICGAEIMDVYHFGKADLERDIDVTDSSMYRIASISKSITSLGLMKLWEEGLFNLDDNISNYFGYEVINPGFPQDSITFRMLLSHTSTLQDGSGYTSFLVDTYQQMPPPSIAEILLEDSAYYTTDTWSNHKPGTYFQYSNLNFGVIASLIEKISNTRFDIFMRENFFEPLKLKSSYNIHDIENINNVAVLYRNGIPQADNYQGTYPPPPNYDLYEIGSNGSLFAPQGGLRISALELSKIMMMLMNNGVYFNGNDSIQILEPSTIDLTLTSQWQYNGGNGNNYYNLFNNWCLGFQKTTNTPNGDIVIDGVNLYGHPGEAYGLISDMYFEREKNFGLVFLTNGYYQGGAYQWGNHSAFYVPEEEVFAIVEDYIYNNCNPSRIKNTTHSNCSVFPNPAGNKLFISIENYPAKFQLRDMAGRIIQEGEITHNNGSFDVSQLGKGIYICEIFNNNMKIEKKKVIVQ